MRRPTGFYPSTRTEKRVSKEESAIPAEIRTVALGSGASGEAVGYLNENVTLQPSTSTGIRHTFLDDFKVKCMETALGYSTLHSTSIA